MKGLFAWVGFNVDGVDYERDRALAGEHASSTAGGCGTSRSRASSASPPRRCAIWTYVGAGISALSFLYGLLIVAKTLIFGIDVPGYASLLVSVLFLGGIQLLGIGIIGEYLGRVYAEIKQRPIYIVRRTYGGTS